MRIIISGDELLQLDYWSVVLATDGRTWTKVPGSLPGHKLAPWYSGSEPLHSRDLADGRPIAVLFDAGSPTEALGALVGMAQEAVNAEDVMSEGLAAYDFLVCWNRRHRYPELGEGRALFEIPVRVQD